MRDRKICIQINRPLMNRTNTVNRAFATAICLLAGFVPTKTSADTLTLSDGSVLNGQIERIEGREIVLNTAYAGKITVTQEQVVEINTTEPVYVQSGSATVFGMVTTSIDGLKVKADEATLSTKVASVDAVWRQGDQNPQEKALARNWVYHATLGLSGKSGNTDRFATLATFNAALNRPDDKLAFYASYDRSEEQDTLTLNEIKGGVDYSRNISPKLNWYARMELESDDGENLDLRPTAAGGVGYIWKDTKNWNLELRSGLAYLYESFNDGTTNDVFGLDFSFLNTYVFTDVATMHNVITFNPAFEDFGNYRIFHESKFEIPIGSGERWKLQLGFANDYTSQPNGDLEELDTTYFTRFLLDWD
jgi:hypothetical protein